MNTEHIALATQLRHPQGEEGIITGLRMQETNADMLQRSLQLLKPQAHDRILEIGPGNGAHVAGLLTSVQGLQYTGLDISETMVQEARIYCQPWVEINKAEFILGNGVDIPYPDNYFNRVLAVNVFYFWENPLDNLLEIYRTLSPGGIFCLAFRSKQFMQHLPFTSHGFKLYDAPDAKALLEEIGFYIQDIIIETEESLSIIDETLTKDRILVLAKK